MGQAERALEDVAEMAFGVAAGIYFVLIVSGVAGTSCSMEEFLLSWTDCMALDLLPEQGLGMSRKSDVGGDGYVQVSPICGQVTLCIPAVTNDIEDRLQLIAFLWVLPSCSEQSLG